MCVQAIHNNQLIEREGSQDKEFHFQNWFKKRLDELQLNFDSPGRNSYPDFRLVKFAEGYELKGLAYPGRHVDYDCNSQVPCGEHNGREVFYVFGRYPNKPDGNTYPVLDLVICHGSFLNADNEYVHKNKSFRGLGSFGDILVRDRKMYVAPTPFALAQGTAHNRTLIVPADAPIGSDFIKVGDLVRREVDQIVAAYSFDLRRNVISTELVPNPHAGREHRFTAYRLKGESNSPVTLTESSRAKFEAGLIVEDDAAEEE